jgi:outer membrane protein TolC
MLNQLLYICVVGSTIALAACQTYRPQPLTESAIEQALTPPTVATLRVQAEQLNHPILKAVELDFDRGLSPDSAAVLALLLNPGLRAIRDQRGLSDAQLLQAGLLPNPQLSTSLDRPAFGNTAGATSAYTLGLGLDLQQLITHAARVRAAGEHRAAVDLDVAWQEWQAAQAAKTAVYQLTALEAQANLSASLDQRLKENLDLARRALDAGLMTELDLAAAETASNQAHANLLDLQKQTERQRLALNRLLGVPSDTRIKLQPDIALPTKIDLPSPERLLGALERRRLDLVALKRGYASQEAAVRAAVLGQFPKINFGVHRARDTAEVGVIGLGLTLELPLFDRNQGAIAQERATRQRLFDEYINRIFEARADIAKLLADARWLNAQIATAQSAEPGLDRLVQTYRVAVNAGQADVLSYYTAWNNLTQKQIEVLTLQRELADTRIALELASGFYRIDDAAAHEKGG